MQIPILRDLNRVEKKSKRALRASDDHYQTGHPHGYLNAMYMGE